MPKGPILNDISKSFTTRDLFFLMWISTEVKIVVALCNLGSFIALSFKSISICILDLDSVLPPLAHRIEVILPPKELIQQYQEKRASLNTDIDRILAKITSILGIEEDGE